MADFDDFCSIFGPGREFQTAETKCVDRCGNPTEDDEIENFV